MEPTVPSTGDLTAARQRLAGRTRLTPVVRLGEAELDTSAHILVKLELLQHSGSFKARGATNALLSTETPAAGVIAASGGNHGAALAWAAASAGIPATIFVPASSPQVKLDRIRGYGAELHTIDGYYAEALRASLDFAERTGARRVHAYDEPGVVAGAATVGSEIVDQVPEATTVLVACGGGGLYAGTALGCAGHARVLPVEPFASAALHAAVDAGATARVDVGGVAVDSLGAAEAGEIALAVAGRMGTQSLLVEDEAITEARRWLWENLRVAVEPGAATPFAALLSGAYVPTADETVVVVLSGANAT